MSDDPTGQLSAALTAVHDAMTDERGRALGLSPRRLFLLRLFGGQLPGMPALTDEDVRARIAGMTDDELLAVRGIGPTLLRRLRTATAAEDSP